TKLALGTLVSVSAERERPFWLDGAGPFPADEVLAFPNGVVHLPSLAAGREDYRIEPTPRFFDTRVVPYPFSPRPPKPRRWLSFLDELFDDDAEGRGLLQEWTGPLPPPDTRHQKILLLIGPSRSGKGTIGRVVTELLGPENVAGASFASLATNFGLE